MDNAGNHIDAVAAKDHIIRAHTLACQSDFALLHAIKKLENDSKNKATIDEIWQMYKSLQELQKKMNNLANKV